MLHKLILSAGLAATLTTPSAAQEPAADVATPTALVDTAAVPTAPADASSSTLADLRTELKSLAHELKSLRAELNASGAKGFAAAGGDSAIDRMNAMERQLSRLTGETERLQNRIERIVQDGTNRIGDIEFRLCEMDEHCDLGALTTPSVGDAGSDLGGAAQGSGTSAAIPQPSPNLPLTAEEKTAFEAASAAMQAGEFAKAADLFDQFARSHTGSPAAAEAQFLRGAALDSAGDPKGATGAWLSAFAAAPAGPRAPDALLGLARVSAVGKPASAACVYLNEVTSRFAGTPQATEAQKQSDAAGCGALAEAQDAAVIETMPADPAQTTGPEAGAGADLVDGG